MQFRRLPPFGGDPRAVAEIVNKIMDGKTNNTGTVTLATGNATSTTLYDERISPDTKIVLIPFSDAAEADTAPYGMFQDDTDQTATTTASAYVTAFNTTDYSNGVYVSDTSRINVRNYGIYAVQYSIQWKNTTNDAQDIDIWLRKNNTDIAKSDSRFGIPARKSSGSSSHLIAVSTFFVELQANDYVEIAWRVSDVGVVMEHYAATTASAGVTPAIPASPSAILTVSYVAPLSYSNIYVSAQTFGEATISHYANATANKTYAYVLVG
jgi:hypothetical protein